MSESSGLLPEERYARALRLDAEYRRRQAGGTAEPLAAFLAAHDDLGDLLEAMLDGTAPSLRTTAPLPAPAPPPTRIGPYTILAELGEGGMGTVYAAEQKEPVRRRVALKLIKLGMDSKAVLARFALERQALAVMNHDAIAKVFDAGTTERGQPYFVMELVEGMPITSYCDQHKLDLAARIALFQQVCQGVQHAHQKGVLHRDLKPGNVLVALRGDQHVAKIIDFGVARATDHQLVAQTIFTEQGMLVGTPEYMSPEQAAGNALAIDTRTDVYSLGVMLYELLAGTLPFPSHELRHAGLLEMQRKIKEDEPQKPSTKITSLGAGAADHARARQSSPRALVKDLRGELDWIVLKAIAKEPERRYDSANALAMDLARHLAHEPVIAGPPGAGYRFKKWARRYRGPVIAGTLVLIALVAGAIGTFLQYLRAEGKVREFDQLAGDVLYRRAVASEQELYPPWPHKIEALETWLREDCGKLLAKREKIERTVGDLRQRALPQTEAEKQHDLDTHPRFAEWQQAERRLASLRRAQAIRDGTPLVVPALSAERQALDANALNTLAWDRVAPKPEERKVYGEEAFGLACARAAIGKPGADHQALHTLAWALLANGQDAESRQRSAEALAAAPADQRPTYEGDLRDVEQAIAGAPKALADLQATSAALDADVHRRQTWTLADEAPRFLHDTLSELLVKLAGLEANEKQQVEQRLAWAQQIEQVSIGAHRARWDAARAAIASSEMYRGAAIELRDRDVIGLVPIGKNPETKLWEFYELRSAWDGKSDPSALPIPAHRPDGSIEVTGDTGIVFVLLPGGTFTMGAQKTDPNGPNFDPQAQPDETPHEVTLAPFFLAKYELTQGQWQRLWSGDESLRAPSYYEAGSTPGGVPVTLANPVEQVAWSMGDGLLRRHGLVLPTEAQWEYGCRAGTTTPWSCPLVDLVRHANVADASAKRAAGKWGVFEEWDDRHAMHAPIGSFLPNAFGLHDVHGNVWEWCLDEYGSYSGTVRAGDGLRLLGTGSATRCNRGGNSDFPAAHARSSHRRHNAPSLRGNGLGARAARAFRLDD